MKVSVRRRVTGIASAMIILVLLLGGVIYLRTASNASRIDNRNLRELTRISQGIESRVNNLQRVLKSLADDTTFVRLAGSLQKDALEIRNDDFKIKGDILERKKDALKSKAALIQNLTAQIDTTDSTLKSLLPGQAIFKIDHAGLLQLSYNGEEDNIGETIRAEYEFSALRPALSSDYMEVVFLADENGGVFLWETDRTGVRIHELAALDTLQNAAGGAVSGIGASDIIQISVAGQTYRLYLLPIRINLKTVQSNNTLSETAFTKWILGGMIPVADYRQQSLSLDPKTALILGFLVIIGFLIVPFVRVFTMGPKERLGVVYLLYLVTALILGTGLAGLFLADTAHYSELKRVVRSQLSSTADTVVGNLDREIRAALEQIDSLNDELFTLSPGDGNHTVDIHSEEFKTHSMRDSVLPAHLKYPYFSMVFWADSEGRQIAKWTPRSQNTPLINVGDRGYFRVSNDRQGWKRQLLIAGDVTACSKRREADTGTARYYIESVRSWTTGENLAVISVPWKYSGSNYKDRSGIAAITTELVSLSHPVLPAGVGLAVVDASARTQFHTRPERILDENFAEETDKSDLLRSVLAARVCKELELTYGGNRMLLVVRPLPGRPLFLFLFKNLSLIDTVRFEAWFEGGALFGVWVLLILILIFVLDRITTSRTGWLWPDLSRPGKYGILCIIALPYIFVLLQQAIIHEHWHFHPTILLIPVQFLGLGLVVLSWNRRPNFRSRESILGWTLFGLSVVFFLVLVWRYKVVQWIEIVALVSSFIIVVVWLRLPVARDFMERRAKDCSPRLLYTAGMFAGLVIIGILPGYLTYQFAFHDRSEHLVKYHQLELMKSLETRAARIDEIMRDGRDDEYRKVMAVQQYDTAFEGLLFGTVKAGVVTGTTGNDHANNDQSVHNQSTNLHDALHGLLGDNIPFLSEASISMRQLSSNQVDREWTVYQGTIQLQINNKELITSNLPSAAGWLGVWQTLLLSGVLGGIFLIVYRVSRWIFFIHLEHSDPLTLEDVLPKSGDEWKSMILVGTRSISREPIRRRKKEVHIIDMISLETGAEGAPKLNLENRPEKKALCLDYFDYRIEEASWNQHMLEFLERNIFSDHSIPLILITSRDLKEALISGESKLEQPEKNKRRWDRVLGQFTKVILSDVVLPDPFEIFLQLGVIRKLTEDLKGLDAEIKVRLVKSEAQGRTRQIKQLIEGSALKVKWLKEELVELRKKLNTIHKKEKQKSSGSGLNVPSAEFKKETETIAKLLDITADKIQLLEGEFRGKFEDDQELIESLILLANAIRGAGRYIADMDVRLEDDGGLDEKREPQSSGAMGLNHLLQRLYNVVRLWIIPSEYMNVERALYRNKKNIKEVYRVLLKECGRHKRLQEIGKQILTRPNWYELKSAEIIDLIREGAETYYAARWAILTENERLVAAQLARGAVVNPKSHQAVTRLIARGLIKIGPELRLDNKSFALFINDTVPEETLNTWERLGIPSTWELIRSPLVIALVIVALFLFWAQREFLGSTITFLGTVGVGVGAILNLLSKLERKPDTAEMKNGG